jgi:Secretion system C-terminal sorting domain
MKKLFTLLIPIFLCFYFNGLAQYIPNFSIADKGLLVPTGTVSSCKGINNSYNPANCSTYNVSGMNWFLTGTSTNPFWMDYAPSQLIERSYAQTLTGGIFQTFRTVGAICVTSPVINIASLGSVTINLAVLRSGTCCYTSEPDHDYVEFKYVLNGGTPVTSGLLKGAGGTTASKTWSVSGNTLQVFACVSSSGFNEQYNVSTFTVSNGTVAPIELSGFFAKINADNQVILDWQTAMERNNAYFDIERSSDGQHFKSIGQVKSFGNTVSGNNYQHADREPLEGVAYYRLKQMDNDGTFDYSPIVSVNKDKAKSKARIISNPVAQVLEIGLSKAENTSLTLVITDLLGRTVAQETRLQNTQTLLTMDVSQLTSGVYVLKVVGKDVQETLKFVKN